MPKRIPLKEARTERAIDVYLPPKLQDAETLKLQDVKEPKLQKVTIYLPLEQLVKLERIRLKRLEHGARVDRSSLVQEAIDALVEEA